VIRALALGLAVGVAPVTALTLWREGAWWEAEIVLALCLPLGHLLLRACAAPGRRR